MIEGSQTKVASSNIPVSSHAIYDSLLRGIRGHEEEDSLNGRSMMQVFRDPAHLSGKA